MTTLEKASKDKVGRKGSVSLNKTNNVAVPSQNLHIDPKGKSSFRGKEFISLKVIETKLKAHEECLNLKIKL